MIFRDEFRTLSQVTDGTSNTLLVVESSEADAVPWMQPRDLSLQNYPNPSVRSNHAGGSNAAFGDGSVKFLSQGLDAQTFSALLSRAGGEVVSGY